MPSRRSQSLALRAGARLADVFGKQVGAGLRIAHLGQPRRRAAVQHLPAMLARRRADIDQPVGAAHGFQVMLDHEQRVARRLQALQGFEQRFAIGRVQTGRGFVQHIDHAEQLRAQLRRQAQALQLAGRQGRRTALQRQITEAQVGQGADPLQQVLGNALRGQAFFHREIRRVAHIGGIGVATGAMGHALLAGLAGLLWLNTSPASSPSSR